MPLLVQLAKVTRCCVNRLVQTLKHVFLSLQTNMDGVFHFITNWVFTGWCDLSFKTAEELEQVKNS